MAVYTYKIETIENYDDDAATEATLTEDGVDGWDLVSITYAPNALTGKSTATLIYMKEVLPSLSSSSTSSSSTSSSSSGVAITGFTFLVHAPSSNTGQAVVLESPGSQSTFAAEDKSYVYRSAMLSDGRVVISGYGSSFAVWVVCYEAGSTTAVDWEYEIVGSSFAYYSDICVLTNGNIVVMWIDISDDWPYFVILDSDGGLVQGITSCDTEEDYAAENDIPNHVIALSDGGFYCYWLMDTSYPAGSVWNSDGSNRVPYYYYEDGLELSTPIRMPAGGAGSKRGYFVKSASFDNNALTLIDPSDMSNYFESIAPHISGNPSWIYMAAPLTWYDRIAVLWIENSIETHYMIVKDDGLAVGATSYLLDNSIGITDLVHLPNGTLLMLVKNASGEYGQNYYILDTSNNTQLSILSGPHAAFTGLSSNPDENSHGCAGSI